MDKVIIFAALVIAVNCRPQVRLHRPAHQNLGPAPRAFPIPNAVPLPLEPIQAPEHHQIPTARKPVAPRPLSAAAERESEEYEAYQNQNAMYQFSSDVEDHINDLTQQRQEVREGNSVKGMYAYSDGYYKRTVHYIADENGYRVTGMEAIPLDGPRIDLMGTASVSNSAHGSELKYKVVSVPVPGPVAKIVDQ